MDDQKREDLRERLLAEALPVTSLNAALPHLRRPFTAEAIKFKVQSTWPRGPEKKGAVIVSYIDARLVIERLNAVVGEAWTADYKPLSDAKLMLCHLTVCGVVRTDVGESSKGLSKDLISDALKRSAVQFGIGVSVYALPQAIWTLEAAGAALKKVGTGDKASLALTPHGHASLRQSYRDWLVETGEPHFGPALDHGDVVWADELPAEVAEDDAVETATAAPEPLTDDVASKLRADIEQAYTELRAVNRRALLPAAFQAELTAVQGSHEGLRELLTRLQDLAADARSKAAA